MKKYITEDAYALSADDDNLTLDFTRGCVVTVPAALPDDFVCSWIQSGVEPIIFVAGEGAKLENDRARTKTTGQGSFGGIHAKGDTFRLIGL